ncbi:MAG: ABC transporter permease [Myxococcales bacterium]|nr:ABC transporter permease [Myxococcales bacterium]
MRAIFAIYKRELLSSFASPMGYVLLASFLVFNGVVFSFFMQMVASNPALSGTRGPLQMFFGSTILSVLTLLIFCPAISMRTFAEERRARTFETLFTTTVTETEVVLGKFFGALTVWMTLWLPTLLYALVVRRYGPVDWGVLASAYLGQCVIGGAFLSLGILMSALSRSQVTAFVLSFLATGGVMFALGLGSYIYTDESRLQFFGYVNLWSHLENFSVGLVDTRALVYYLSVTALGLGLTVNVLAGRKEA